MKIAALVLVLYAATTAGAEVDVRVVKLGTETTGSDTGLVERTIEFVQSCVIDSTKDAASPVAWQNALRAPSLIHLRFSSPRDLAVAGHIQQLDEILVPLPKGAWPDQVFARRGEVVLSFTFYDPRAFRDLVWGAPFAFKNTPPYDDLATLPND